MGSTVDFVSSRMLSRSDAWSDILLVDEGMNESEYEQRRPMTLNLTDTLSGVQVAKGIDRLTHTPGDNSAYRHFRNILIHA
jgi:hypothetical protein